MVPACFLSLSSFEPLKLRRPDSRRSTTQTWYFSSGMLTCGLPRLVVQVGQGPGPGPHPSLQDVHLRCNRRLLSR